MKRALLILFLASAIAAGAWLYHRSAQPARSNGAAARREPAPVTVAEVTVKSVPLERRTFGTVEPAVTVDLRSQITGVLTNVAFTEGQEVRAGDLLFVIDPRPLEAQLAQAEANRMKDAAQLRNAEKEAGREDELFKKGFAAEDTRDRAHTEVETLRALLQADDAAVANARLQLDYCRIRAPANGRMGRLMVHAGNLVKANDVTLATLNQIKPVFVRFSLPQQDLGLIRERMAAAPLTVMASLPAPSSTTCTGTLVFVDNAVDAATGAIAMKARFDNEDEALWPGRFVNVTLRIGVDAGAVVAPARAILPGQRGDYVYVVNADGSVSNRPVRVARTHGDDAVIAGDLSAGERVVTDGQLRLTPGVRVSVKPPAAARP